MTRLLAVLLEPLLRYGDWALTRMVRVDMDGAGTSDKGDADV